MFYIWMETHVDVEDNTEIAKKQKCWKKVKRMDEKNTGNREVQHPRKCWSSACASDLSQHYRRCQGNQEHIHIAIMGLFTAEKNPHKWNQKCCVLSTCFTLHANWHILLFMTPSLFLISLINNGALPSKQSDQLQTPPAKSRKCSLSKRTLSSGLMRCEGWKIYLSLFFYT